MQWLREYRNVFLSHMTVRVSVDFSKKCFSSNRVRTRALPILNKEIPRLLCPLPSQPQEGREPVGETQPYSKASAKILSVRTGHVALPPSEVRLRSMALAGPLPSHHSIFLSFYGQQAVTSTPVWFHHPRPFFAAPWL